MTDAAELLLAYDDALRAYGADHPDTFAARNAIDRVVAMGEPGDTIVFREEFVAAAVRLLGPEHPETLRCQHNLAADYLELERPQQSIALLESMTSTQRRVLGAESRGSLISELLLAHAYDAGGRHDDALALFRATLATLERTLAPNDILLIELRRAIQVRDEETPQGS